VKSALETAIFRATRQAHSLCTHQERSVTKRKIAMIQPENCQFLCVWKSERRLEEEAKKKGSVKKRSP